MAVSASKQQKIDAFDINGIGQANGHLFGLPFGFEDAEVVILPVPWEVTVSYRPGTAGAPEAILEASYQVDLYDADLPDAWKRGVYMLSVSPEWGKTSRQLRVKAAEHIRLMESGHADGSGQTVEEVNDASNRLRKWVFEQCSEVLEQGKLPALLGGDHSTPLGLMQALSLKYPSFGILQIDAHADLRKAYEGFTYSHASIMYNALQIEQVKGLVQVGLRDVCQEEMDLIRSDDRIHAFFHQDIRRSLYEGHSWKQVCATVIDQLPEYVYISFDIDGLDPKLCPNTGTPVAGGFEYAEVVFLIQELVHAGKKVIGFDLVEVGPSDDEWDANVGARLLYKLSNLMLKSQGK